MDNFQFSVSTYGELEPYNEVMSKCRLRVFYKYENRNGSYITDEFANKLLSSISYAPIKGIFSFGDDDFGSHGTANDEGRIYGIVPENPNLKWEPHLDEDGVERLYACVDVLLYTSLYKEANQIQEKSQSMELYAPSIKYHKAIIGGNPYVVFDEGCFLGLQVLGDTVEPCFEGSAFFALDEKALDSMFNLLDTKGDSSQMDFKYTFELSFDEITDAIFKCMNPRFNEADGQEWHWNIVKVYNGYAILSNNEDYEFYRVDYKKACGECAFECGEPRKVQMMFLSENEVVAVEALRQLNGGSFELVNEDLTKVAEWKAQVENLTAEKETLTVANSELNTKLVDKENEFSTLNQELDTAKSTIQTLQTEIAAAEEFKLSIARNEKNAVISKYEGQLDEEVLNPYRDSIDNYTAEEIDMHLVYELHKRNPARPETTETIVPVMTAPDGIESILARYKH